MANSIMKRRDLLRTLGAAAFLAQPVFRDTFAEAQPSAFPLRFVVLTVPGGVYHKVSGDAGNFGFDTTLKSFASLESEMLFLDDTWNEQCCGGAAPHSESTASVLSGSGPTSIDAVVGPKLGATVKFSSLQFGVFTGAPASTGRDNTTAPAVDEPAVMFNRLFGGSLPTPAPTTTGTATAPPAVDTGARRRALLDHLKGEVQLIKQLASTKEQQKLDQHLTSLSELEKQIPTTMTGGTFPGGGVVGATPSVGCKAPTSPEASSDLPVILTQQLDLMYQALACDLSRVATSQILKSGCQSITFPWLGVSADHHALEHNFSPDVDTVNTYFFDQYAAFVKRLQATPEGSGTMLDNTLVFLTSELASGGDHNSNPGILATVGRAGGGVRAGGRRIGYGQAPHVRALRSIANALGVDHEFPGDEGGAALISLS
ncbi:MAG: DUF1552 domain-containing protein [Polyangiaceae bacterium]|nr:DUF1552 domain-containing protein [Polyangiaceae bacterium]